MNRETDHLSDKTIDLVNERHWSDEHVIALALTFMSRRGLIKEFSSFLEDEARNEADNEIEDYGSYRD